MYYKAYELKKQKNLKTKKLKIIFLLFNNVTM